MSYGPIQRYYGTIASGASTCTSIDLGSKAYSQRFLEVSTMSTNAALTVFGSSDGTTFRQLYWTNRATSAVQFQAMTIATGVINGIVPLDASVQYLQFRASAVVSGGCSLTVICSD